jgi:uncharacterized membrane protein
MFCGDGANYLGEKMMRSFMRPRQHFTIRGKEILRIEALSDAVFAFAVSLLAVALEVPQNFHELKVILRGACLFSLPFHCSFYSGTSSMFSFAIMH